MKTKKLFVILCLIFLIVSPFSCVLSANEVSDIPSISSEAAFLMDVRTNKVLYSKEENKKMYPASTTKILTAILVLENCHLDDTVTASYTAISSVPDGYSTAKIQVGEQLTVEQLLELLLVISANDAANVLAEYTGGSLDSFVSMMNTKLHELGLTNTHFTNSYGKQDENHYTTARDMAFLMKYCLQNDTFLKIAGKASCAIPTTNMSEPRTYASTNELLIPGNKNYYRYLIAGKTGYTSRAKECLVSSAYRDDLQLIGVVLASDNRFSDSRRLYEYAYSHYSIQNIIMESDVVTNIEISNATNDTKNLDLLISETIPALVKNSTSISEIDPQITLEKNISAPIEEGSVLGKATYTIDGVSYTSNLIASHAVQETEFFTYVFYVIGFIFFTFLTFWIFFHKDKKACNVTEIKLIENISDNSSDTDDDQN